MNATKITVKNAALERAITHFGSLTEMARALDLSGYQVIQQWRRAGRVPSPHVPKLAALTGESREDLVGWPPLESEPISSSDDVQPPSGISDRGDTH